MAEQLTTAVVSILTAVVGVATLSVILSKQANTVGVLQAGSSGFSQILGTALTPIVGGSGFATNTGLLQ